MLEQLQYIKHRLTEYPVPTFFFGSCNLANYASNRNTEMDTKINEGGIVFDGILTPLEIF